MSGKSSKIETSQTMQRGKLLYSDGVRFLHKKLKGLSSLQVIWESVNNSALGGKQTMPSETKKIKRVPPGMMNKDGSCAVRSNVLL